MTRTESEGRSDVRRHSAGVLTSSRVLIIRRVLITIGATLSTAAIARQLTTTEFAAYSVALATFYLAQAVCDLGFAQVVVREMAQRPHDRSALMRNTLMVSTAWSLVVVVGFVLYAWIAGKGSGGYALYILAPALAATGLSVCRQWFIVDYRVQWIARIDTILNLLSFVLLVAVAYLGGGPALLVLVICLAAISNAVIVAIAVFREMDGTRTHDGGVRSILKMALPIGIPSVLASAYFSVDLVIAASILPAHDVANYAAAVKFLTMIAIIPQILMSVALPGFSSLSKTAERVPLGELVGEIWAWLAAIGVPVCVGTACFAPLAIGLLFGPQYDDAASLLTILMLAAVVSLASNVLGTLVVAQGIAGRLFFQNIVALVATVGLNVWLLPIYGVEAAAWITVGIEVFLASMSFIWLRRRCAWGPVVRCSVKPLFCTVLIVLVALLPVWSGWGRLGLAIVIFVVSMSALRAWPFDTLAMARTAARRVARR